MSEQFWKEKKLEEMSKDEWESLCDGCGLCCLIRLEDEDTGEIVQSNIACKYLDLDTCKCTDYKNRKKNVPDCWIITPENIHEIYWMPDTCAYKLVYQGQDLYDWHPLKSGDKNSTHKEGISYIGEMVSEDEVDIDDAIQG
ncbi:MAG: YcgN family cysteine cluster protein [Rickettsiales bacterium]|nr:YcgN family cysteine cluster protein [Pseudomonadota bacterium]MDA0966581.1 YcgN family cysteine cluster protein [Pseudomonadota bacterium]MDG4543610.1 YcgN family cysteine cluster protein [Rickettsiales bacterium]MDG4545757.1 YcgN family cysteine cluster protein [Rickettsiales bacterium]MDG4547470.1 YcgN family cysteine cluster protein [Rickettsiales bacterium]